MPATDRRPLAVMESRGVTKSTHWTCDEWAEVEAEAQVRGLEPAVLIRNLVLTHARMAYQHRSVEASLGNPAAMAGGSPRFAGIPKVLRGSPR